ncbi:protein serine/threonine kinase, putative [Entamoeba invadens IP1]|uniref:Protein serine/threonine kinase, putative n=1 Tax=Entamoeba invadens IP1 TaxID=370355 RepID=A0A0A1UAV8_ENTIV|nr:protein serine/threonine kinase, putative [Entamoeba invadens IP1]ELP89293.1 protein serine/threonine kinase, putative [Entamoeba invadens IP1]|eukprot:XP_004256064.1 protein serine/threonine kinase, putative [Entamoeba invadens IP1]
MVRLFVLIFFLRVSTSIFENWMSDSDNHIRYYTNGKCIVTDCKTGFDVKQENTFLWLGKYTYTYTFSGSCCFSGRDYYYIDPYSSECSKVVEIQSTSTLKILHILESSPQVKWTYKLQESKNNAIISIENTRNSIDSGYETTVQIGSFPVYLKIQSFEILHIDFINTQRPYFYIEATTLTQDINMMDTVTGCVYAFSGVGLELSVTSTGLFPICEIGRYRRYTQCDTNTTPVQSCMCFINAPYSVVNFKDFTMNYPDCTKNSTIFKLTILSNQTQITFDNTSPSTWGGLVFQQRQDEDIVLIFDNSVIIQSTTTLPPLRVTLKGSVQFENIVFPQTKYIHILSGMAYKSANFSNQNGKIVFLSRSSQYDGVKLLCLNGERSRYGLNTDVGCVCRFEGNVYWADDCERSSLMPDNTLHLIISQKEVYNAKEGVYFSKLVAEKDSYLLGTMTAQSCIFEGGVKVYGTVICDSIEFVGDISVLESGLITSKSVIMNGSGTILGNIESDYFIITENSVYTIADELETSISIVMGKNSNLNIEDHVEVKQIDVLGSSTLQTKTCVLDSVNGTGLSIISDEIIVHAISFDVAQITTSTPMTIGEEVKTLYIGAITYNSHTERFLLFDNTTNEILISRIPTCVQCSNVVFFFADDRIINGIATDQYSCDRQIVVIGQTSDFVGCQVLELDNKICFYSTKERVAYSCPCFGDTTVTCVLVIDSMDYTIEANNYPNEIFILTANKLTTNDKIFVLYVSSLVTLSGNNNAITLEMVIPVTTANLKSGRNKKLNLIKQEEQPKLIVEGANLIFSEEGNWMDYTESKTIVSSENGTCKLMHTYYEFLIHLKFDCVICRHKRENGICVNADASTIPHCQSISPKDQKLCENCEYGYFFNGDECIKCPANCNICDSPTHCLSCQEDYLLGVLDATTTSCIEQTNCVNSRGGVCSICPKETYLNDGKCELCNTTHIGCIQCTSGTTCDICDVSLNYTKRNGKCVKISGFVSEDTILSCDVGYYDTSENCVSCSLTRNCETCNTTSCLSCITNYILTNENTCVPVASFNYTCEVMNSRCISCSNSNYSVNGYECGQCGSGCSSCDNSNNCISCDDQYYLTSEYNKVGKLKDVCSLTQTVKHCLKYFEGRCVECEDEFFLTNGNCVACISPCKTCVNSNDKCVECLKGFIKSGDTCYSIKYDLANCTEYYQQYCKKCVVGYYVTQDLKCAKCPENCETCYQSTVCTKCASNYFINSSHLCSTNKDIHNCKENSVGVYGCTDCVDGYFIDQSNNNNCALCNSTLANKNCTSCDKNGICTKCESLSILSNNMCTYYRDVAHCVAVYNSQCIMCDWWYVINASATGCEKQPKWEIFLIIFLFVFEVSKIVVIFGTAITKKIVKRVYWTKMEYFDREVKTKFKMSHSNVKFLEHPGSDITFSTRTLTFGSEMEWVKVNVETKEKFCIGNCSRKLIKINISVIENNEKYEFKISPTNVILCPGEACEFEGTILPKCTSKITEKISVEIIGLLSNTSSTEELKMVVETEISTRLDPDELKTEKKLGEGSFGVVFLGFYKGNRVAIKKLKITQIKSESEQMKEFEREVAMLDKFRSDFIVHFFGACFLPTKICMVTEFAEYGSLNDLMKRSKCDLADTALYVESDTPNLTETPLESPSESDSKKAIHVPYLIRVKFLFDAARGVEYLHKNGIMHRDIKPDNILVITIERNVNVNAKLTDFGSSRNTSSFVNMTFTNGVGTPAFMAPEILRREKYQTPADIYSLAVTMFSVLKWTEPFDGDDFKYPWDIANFVSDGKRLDKPSYLSNEIWSVITKAWAHQPDTRVSANTVVEMLETYYDKINNKGNTSVHTNPISNSSITLPESESTKLDTQIVIDKDKRSSERSKNSETRVDVVQKKKEEVVQNVSNESVHQHDNVNGSVEESQDVSKNILKPSHSDSSSHEHCTERSEDSQKTNTSLEGW